MRPGRRSATGPAYETSSVNGWTMSAGMARTSTLWRADWALSINKTELSGEIQIALLLMEYEPKTLSHSVKALRNQDD